MKQKVRILNINPCGCDAEGKITLTLLASGIEIICDYQGSDQHVYECFSIGEETEADISLWLDKVDITEQRSLSIKALPGDAYEVIGRYKGTCEYDGSQYYIVDSLIELRTTNEFNDDRKPAETGEWVSAVGLFYIELL
ncbi:hypothetical protein [Psychromonas aquimarina]|uniref:hypothetical protein n=1 Tax=Psychromonas aquimarina TaxID=444919 RepID=UPI00040543AD|nr:hypothetical protein [Psychromonas aquimarina]